MVRRRLKKMNSLYVSDIKKIIGKYFMDVLNYSIRIYNHNIENIYLFMFDILDSEFNFIISVLFDFYVNICQHIGNIIINGNWEHYRHKIILNLVRNQYICYIHELRRRLHIIKIYIILLENSLRYQGWALIEIILQFKSHLPPNLVRKPIVNEKFIQPLLLSLSDIQDLKNINSVKYNLSPTVKYINEVTDNIVYDIFNMIIKKFENISWLEDILICSLYEDNDETELNSCNQQKKDVSQCMSLKIQCLQDILLTKDLNIYKENSVYKYKK